MEKKFTETTYVICHNGADVIHPAQVEPGTVLTTGQPNVEEFATEGEWKARLTELGYKFPEIPQLDGALSHGADLEGKFNRRGMRAARTPEARAARKEIREGLKAERAAIKAAQSPEERKQLRQALKAKRTEALNNLSAQHPA